MFVLDGNDDQRSARSLFVDDINRRLAVVL